MFETEYLQTHWGNRVQPKKLASNMNGNLQLQLGKTLMFINNFIIQ